MKFSLVDRTVELISPKWALAREQAKGQLEVQRKFAAAKSGQMTGNWLPRPESINSQIRSSWATVTGRTLALANDFPAFGNAINALETHVVGTGIRYQPTVRKANGDLDTKTNTLIEEGFHAYADSDEFDLARKITFYEAQALAVVSESKYGEFLYERRTTRRKHSEVPFAYKSISPSRLTSSVHALKGSNEVYEGIEFNQNTMENIRYWLDDGEFNPFGSKQISIPAASMLHGFHTVDSDQMRGITPFASVVLLAQRYQDYMESEIDIQRMSSKWLAFMTTPNPLGDYTGKNGGVNYDAALKQFQENLGYMMIERIPEGADIKLNNTQRSTSGLKDFHQLVNELIAAVFQLPPELISNNYDALRYTNGRISRNDFHAALKVRQARIINKLCKPVFKDWLIGALSKGTVVIPGFDFSEASFARLMKGKWIAPGMPAVDPYKEGQIAIDLVNNRLASPQEFIVGKGGDTDKVVRDNAEFEKALEAHKLLRLEGGSPSNTNPQAIADSKNSKKKDDDDEEDED